ncbi:MAG: pirin family protein [Crocinitomicaceae bacterium]
MKKIIHRANSRNSADFGWLKVNHSFSFANWYDPNKINFGALRVLNDDTIQGQKGFDTHPHDNMEIITIPLSGPLAHKDSMGNASTIKAGEIQVMSAGSGVRHSEFNPSDDFTNLFQIWIFPNKRNVEPRYDQIAIDVAKMKNNFLQLVSPFPEDEGSWIHQNAWVHMAEMDANEELNYSVHSEENGIYAMVVEGEINIQNESFQKRDAVGLWEEKEINFVAKTNSKVLVIEVPMLF